MARRARIAWGAAPLLAACCAACSADVAFEPEARSTPGAVASSVAALTDLPRNAVPIPVNPDTQEATWDGTYPELLAADALVECTFKQNVPIGEYGIGDGDLFLSNLWSNMNKAMCSGPLATNPPPPLQAWGLGWLMGRASPACNVDPVTRQGQGLNIDYAAGGANGTDSPYGLPALATYQASTPSPAFTGAELEQARIKAQDQVHYAWVNVCMAQKLREHLESIQVAFATEGDLLQLQAIIRDRAARAVFQYTTIVRTIDGSFPSTTIANPWAFANLIRQWPTKDAQWSSKAARLGQDFASAVQILADVSEQHTESLVRNGSTKPGLGDYDSTPTSLPLAGPLDSGLDGPRMDALAAAYGQASSASRRGAVTDMRAPEIGTLLGIARAANALQLTGANKSFNLQTNATNLLNAVERHVRQKDCIARGDLTAGCYAIPAGTTFDQYLVRKRFNIQLVHANALIEALLEQLYGQPNREQYVSGGPWTYRFDAQDVLLGLPLDLTERFQGTHTYSGDFSSTGGGTLTIQPTSSLQPLASSVMQSQAWAYLPAPTYNFSLHPYDQGYALRSETNGYYRYGRQQNSSALGSQNVLAYARYAVSRAHLNANAIVIGAGPNLWKVLEHAAGSRQVVIRRQLGSLSSSSCSRWGYLPTGGSTWVTPTNCQVPTDVTNASGILLDVYVNTKATDLYNRLARRTITNPTVVPALTAIGATSETVDSSISSVTGQTLRKFSVAIPANEVADLRMLDLVNREQPLYRGKLEPPMSYAGLPSVSYMPIQTFQRAAVFGRAVSYGGTLNTRIERAWRFQDNEWSRPAYDGLDLRTDWAPVGDASLHGGQPGEEAYQYFLRAASNAAGEASSAIDKAFELLSIESQDALALKQAEQRGKTLSQLEEQAYCGNAASGASTSQASCAPTFVARAVVTPVCPSGTVGLCATMYDGLNKLLGTLTSSSGVMLASDVDSQRTSAVASFSRYAGGQLEQQLVAQWDAWRALELALKTALDTSVAAEAEVVSALAEKNAADTQYNSEVAMSLTNLFNAAANVEAARQDIQRLMADHDQWALQEQSAWITSQIDCGDTAAQAAHDAGFTWDPDSARGRDDGPSKRLSLNSGPWDSFLARCDEATRQYIDVLNLENPLLKRINAGIVTAQGHIELNNWVQVVDVPSQLAAAQARFEAAPARVLLAEARGMATLATQLQLVQRAIADLLEATAALSIGANQSQLAKARIDLEKTLEVAALDNRFNVRRSYRSYDLWRARALSENARRLAVAARRAIESRFVVDLSTMNAPETFVEAPALWADEIFSPDLKPPSALGRTAAPANGEGLYSSKLSDYVDNLQLFVNGYAIQRPAATVRSDSDVVQLPGPAAVVEQRTALDTVVEYRDQASSGWSFYCANSSSWKVHPQSAAFDPAAWSLATMCGGVPPTHARLSFWLDPWGRFLGSRSKPPFNDRHNARWRDFALNLVGSGIRDCSKARDSRACYAEPFIRYELKHVGPALVSDYDRSWVSTDIPSGMVEGGKALASEEWLDPATNGFSNPTVQAIARQELAGRPLGGAYELTFELTPDVRLERIDRIQLLMQSDYWVRQQ